MSLLLILKQKQSSTTEQFVLTFRGRDGWSTTVLFDLMQAPPSYHGSIKVMLTTRIVYHIKLCFHWCKRTRVSIFYCKVLIRLFARFAVCKSLSCDGKTFFYWFTKYNKIIINNIFETNYYRNNKFKNKSAHKFYWKNKHKNEKLWVQIWVMWHSHIP